MSYSGSLLKINGTTIPNIKSYKLTYAKLWANADRNMNGDVRATFIGIFPKIELEIGGVLNEDTLSPIVTLLNEAYFSVTYFDAKSKGTKTAQYYASDYTVEILDRSRGLFKPFSVSLVPVSRMN